MWLLLHDSNFIMGDTVALIEPITMVISANVTEKNARHWCKSFYTSPVTCLIKGAYKVISDIN